MRRSTAPRAVAPDVFCSSISGAHVATSFEERGLPQAHWRGRVRPVALAITA